MRKLDLGHLDRLCPLDDALPERTDYERLVLLGLSPRPPEALDDAELPARLWEVLEGLADLGRVLLHTDHLSDRELYEVLWHDILRDPVPDPEPGIVGRQVVDILGGWGPDDLHLYLRYYVEDEERADLADGIPEEEIPRRQPPPYDRDAKIAEMCGFV